MTATVASRLRAALAREQGIIAVCALQLTALAAVIYFSPGFWPRDDDATYLSQGVTLWMGHMPPDPTRPVFYPFLISLGLRLTGLSIGWLRMLQSIFLVLTTLLTYRLARVIAGRRTALLAAALYAAFPETLFYSTRFYRESLTACFLVLTLNLIEWMERKPLRPVPSLAAGMAAGMLVLTKPEFGLFLAVLAAAAAIAGLWRRDLRAFRARVQPWIICGGMALLTTVPAAVAARRAYHEWVFIATYRGYTYCWSFCGDLEPKDAAAEEKSFFERDSGRLTSIFKLTNSIMYGSGPEFSYGERDRFLQDKAREYIRRDPGQVLELTWNRLILAWFMAGDAAWAWYIKGDYGAAFPAPLMAAIQLESWAMELFTLCLLAPGLAVLFSRPGGRPGALLLLSYPVFYATVYYVPRYRVAVWPALMIAAAAGLPAAAAIIRRGAWPRRALLAFYLGAVLFLFDFASPQVHRHLFGPAEPRPELGTGLEPNLKTAFLEMLAAELARGGGRETFAEEMGGYIRERSGSLPAGGLAELGGRFAGRRMPWVADFFYRAENEYFGAGPETAERLAALSARRRTDAVTNWELAGTIGSGLAVYRARLSAAVEGDPGRSIVDTDMHQDRRVFHLNPGLPEGLDIGPYQYTFRGDLLFLTLPDAEPPPGPDRPVTADYFSVP